MDQALLRKSPKAAGSKICRVREASGLFSQVAEFHSPASLPFWPGEPSRKNVLVPPACLVKATRRRKRAEMETTNTDGHGFIQRKDAKTRRRKDADANSTNCRERAN